MKKLLALFALLGVLLVAGCGGEGTEDTDVVLEFLNEYQAAWEDEDLDYFSSLISPSYLQGCQDKYDLVAIADDYFSDPLVEDIRFEYRGVVESDIDYASGYAYFSTEVRFSYYYDDELVVEDLDFTSVIRQEGFIWRLYGDQTCSGAAVAGAIGKLGNPFPPTTKKL